MELSSQQAQALTYFDRVSAEWRMKAEGRASKVNVIAQRNACAHRVGGFLPNFRSMLDVGCGTGELVLEMAARNISSTGIDFAPEMIRACKEKRSALAQQNAHFHCCSVFQYDPGESTQDLISALGFIEYISPAELTDLLRFSHRVLRQGGALVLGSRNRLFNLVSLNEYTRMEVALGTPDRLLDEAIAFSEAGDLETALAAFPGERLPQPDVHPGTGISVAVRYQYTPGELAAAVREAGFAATALFPVHYHAVPPRAKARMLEMHVAFSDSIFETAGHDLRLIPFSSSFVLGACKN